MIKKLPIHASRSQVIRAQKDLVDWYKKEMPSVMVGKCKARRFYTNTKDGLEVIINKNFYQETINKYQDDILYPLKLAYARKAIDLIKEAELVNPDEPSIDHPNEIFKVYKYIDDCYEVEMKLRCNRDGNYLHIIRIYKK
ncbi:MAG: hypothetical protein MJY59_00510 [Bacteroidaceae bacterium]|nr:hypothetical protein [Bacteroidaceae bacterium]